MKNKISLVTIVMILLVVVVGVYYFTYFVPAQTEMTQIQAEIALNNAQAALYEEYITDTSELEAEIAAIQAEIDELYATGSVNQTNVSLVISDAIQRYRISLTAVSLGTETTYEEHKALPINLSIVGKTTDITDFIAHFEEDTAGSYLVRSSSLEINGTDTTASLLIYLLMPNV